MNYNAIFQWIVSDVLTESQRQIDVPSNTTDTEMLVRWVVNSVLTDEQLDVIVPSEGKSLRELV